MPKLCSRGHSYTAKGPCPGCWPGKYQSDFPKISLPSLRALANANIADMEALARHSESEIAQLHGMGPNALATLKNNLSERGLSFSG